MYRAVPTVARQHETPNARAMATANTRLHSLRPRCLGTAPRLRIRRARRPWDRCASACSATRPCPSHGQRCCCWRCCTPFHGSLPATPRYRRRPRTSVARSLLPPPPPSATTTRPSPRTTRRSSRSILYCPTPPSPRPSGRCCHRCCIPPTTDSPRHASRRHRRAHPNTIACGTAGPTARPACSAPWGSHTPPSYFVPGRSMA